MTTKEMRELDQWLYENLPGLKSCKCINGLYPKWGDDEWKRMRKLWIETGGKPGPLKEPDVSCNHAPKYSTTADAMEVLKRCAEKTLVVIRGLNTGAFSVGGKELDLDVEAETLELAICFFSKKLYEKRRSKRHYRARQKDRRHPTSHDPGPRGGVGGSREGSRKI